MATPVRDAPEITVPPSSPLGDVLRRVNRIRTKYGVDPLYRCRLLAPPGTAAAQDAVAFGEEPPGEDRRALDVGEQEGDSATWRLHVRRA